MSHYNQQPRLACIMSLARTLLLLPPLLMGACAASPNLPVRISTTEGTVVDAETKAPLAGVVVQRHLPTVYMKRNGKAETCDIPIAETVTDAQGHFVLEGKTHYCGEAENMYFTQGGSIIFYKGGYWPTEVHNKDGRIMDRIYWPDSWWSDWDGKVIELKPMHWREWSKEKWEKEIKKNEYLWGYGYLPNHVCGWMKVPENIIEDIRFDLRRNKILYNHTGITKDTRSMIHSAKECGVDVFQYLRNYGLSIEEWNSCCKVVKKDNSIRKIISIPKNLLLNSDRNIEATDARDK